MDKSKRHYIRNSVRNEIKNKDIFFIVWKLVRMRDILTQCTNYLTYRLNDCGWLFRKGDYNYELYKMYQKKEELNRLLTWVINDTRKRNSIDDKQKLYIKEITDETYCTIKKTSMDKECMLCDMAFKYNRMIQEKYKKIIAE